MASCPSTGETVWTHTPEQWLNSPSVLKARQEFANNTWPKECRKCQLEEQNIGKSRRTDREIMGPGITHLDLRFGNSCNLKCITCGSLSSSSINNEASEMKAKNIIPINTININNVDNWYDERFFEYFSNLPLIEVALAGGEPMMIKYLPEFLDRLDRSVKIRFTTNGTICNPKLFKLLQKFNIVVMTVSMDAIGKRIEYIRYGTKWEDIERNTLMYKDNFNVDISPCFSVLNTLYADEIFEWADKNNIRLYDDNILITPEHLSVQHAPDSLKSQFNRFHNWFEKPSDLNHQKTFIHNTMVMDSYRNIRIQDYLPEVAKAYGIS